MHDIHLERDRHIWGEMTVTVTVTVTGGVEVARAR